MTHYTMELNNFDSSYWNKRYTKKDTPWDIGYASPPLIDYCRKIKNKKIKILIPGCGNAHEFNELNAIGFENIFICDISEIAISKLKNEIAGKFHSFIIHADFFALEEKFDLILEQTFFCALAPSQRDLYCRQSKSLLTDEGVIAGVLFNKKFNTPGPPFGGNISEYVPLFSKYFNHIDFKFCENSIKPRAGTELFFECKK